MGSATSGTATATGKEAGSAAAAGTGAVAGSSSGVPLTTEDQTKTVPVAWGGWLGAGHTGAGRWRRTGRRRLLALGAGLVLRSGMGKGLEVVGGRGVGIPLTTEA